MAAWSDRWAGWVHTPAFLGVCELPPPPLLTLLRHLQEQPICRVGSSGTPHFPAAPICRNLTDPFIVCLEDLFEAYNPSYK